MDNRVGIAFINPELNVMSNKRISDNLAVYIQYTGELLAILNRVISTLTSIKHMQSDTRQDIICNIAQTLFRIKRTGIEIIFMWIPAHIGVDGN